MLQVLDTVWRIFQTVRIIRRFWGRSSLSVQPVDVTTDVESRARVGAALNPARGVAYLLTHPLMMLGNVLVFVFLIGGVAFSLYQPIFRAYQTDCIAKDSDGRARTRTIEPPKRKGRVAARARAARARSALTPTPTVGCAVSPCWSSCFAQAPSAMARCSRATRTRSPSTMPPTRATGGASRAWTSTTLRAPTRAPATARSLVRAQGLQPWLALL